MDATGGGSGTSTPLSRSTKTQQGVTKSPFAKKEQIRCLLCGGKDCSKCGLEAYKQLSNPALDQLHSHWINDTIIAMQRPNDTALDNGALTDMVKKKVSAVFNLTEPGEHPYCGTGVLAASGFPYSPEKLMHAGIKHFNFSWQDMTVPSLQRMFDIVHIAITELINGGKIAVHCHAGFGRTGLVIACVLIAKDLLPSEQVIQFVRNRRPGSIQTTAQQQFIGKFERAMYVRMQIFPTFDFDAKRVKGETGGSSLHVKTVQQSVQDQQYFLTPTEVDSHRFKHIHKVMFYSCTAMKRLSFDNFIVACLALTGLTRLTIKKNLEMETDDTKSPPVTAGSKPNRKVLKKKSSFMVATNSLSESGEENILSEVKMELNNNKWTRLFAITDVVAADLLTHPDSFRAERHESANHSFAQLRKGLSSGDNSVATLPNDKDKDRDKAKDGERDKDAKGGNGGGDPDFLGKGQSALLVDAMPTVEEVSPCTANRADSLSTDEVSAREVIAKQPSVRGGIALQDVKPPSVEVLSRSASQQGTAVEPKSSSSPPRAMGPPALSLSRLRSNSLRVITDSELTKSRKMAINLMAQLLLDWLETRQQPLLSQETVNALGEIFQSHGHRHFKSVRRMSVDDPKDLPPRQASAQLHRDSSSNRPFLSSASADSERGRMDPFNTSVKAQKQPELNQAISTYLHDHLDRYHLELLNTLVSMYKTLRRAGRDTVYGSMQSSQRDTSRSATSSGAVGSQQPLGMEEFEALEALVGLRLAIACMHARKQYSGLIRQRAVVIDLVKVFLLKSTHSDLVIINNITFSEESYENVKNTIGTQVIYQLDVVFRTLRLLADDEWRKPTERLHHWKGEVPGIHEGGHVP